MKTITIEVLYPEFNNLYGDRGNLLYLTKKLASCDCPLQVLATHLHETPAFVQGGVDLLLIGPCTERQQELELEQLLPRRDAIQQRIDQGGVTLATGNAFELFGEYIQRENGEQIPALGLFPFHAERFERLRYNERCAGKLGDLTVVGFKNQLSHSYVHPQQTVPPLLHMEVGSGWNPTVKTEGIHVQNFFATYLLGPLLPLNPAFTDRLIQTMLDSGESPAELPWERTAYDVRLQELYPREESVSN